MSRFVSACCHAPISVVNNGNDAHYVCGACGQPCALAPADPSPLDPLPVCLGCWRQRFGMYEQLPPPPKDWPTETCHLCGHPTTHGLYLLRGTNEPHILGR